MNGKLLLIMGLISMLGMGGANAQEQKNKKQKDAIDVFDHDVNVRERTRKMNIRKCKPIYKKEMQALATADVLYLIDRKDVDLESNQYDTAKLIALTAEEKSVIAEAYSKGKFDVLDFGEYDDKGLPIMYTPGEYHNEPPAPLPYYAYLFAVKSRDTEDVFTISYIHNRFRVYASDFDVTISEGWRREVNAVIKKHCSDSFSQSEEFWEGKRREKAQKNCISGAKISTLKAVSTTDTIYLVDRKYASVGSRLIVYIDSDKIPLVAKEKDLVTDIITEAYSNGVFILYDEVGNIEYTSKPISAYNEEPAAIDNPVDGYAYLLLLKDYWVSYKNGVFGDQRYQIVLSGELKKRMEAIIQKYCPESFAKSEEYWRTYKIRK